MTVCPNGRGAGNWIPATGELFYTSYTSDTSSRESLEDIDPLILRPLT